MNALAAELRGLLTSSANLRAFQRMLRVGEGTADENGYRRMFAGRLFESFADHPRIAVTAKLGGKPITSTAAGAYQFLSRTWNECRTALDLPDFSPLSQDIAAVFLIRRRGALADVLAGRIEAAIRRCNREWASLPGSPYGQPVRTMAQALGDFARYLASETQPETPETPPQAPIEVAPLPEPQPAPETAPATSAWRSDPIPLDPINAPQGEPMHPAIIPIAIEALKGVVPKLGELFATSDTAKRNVQAAQAVIETASAAIGARNAQEMVEAVQADPQAASDVRAAIEANWFKIEEAAEKSVAAARDFNLKFAETGGKVWELPAFWISCGLLLPLYAVVGSVLWMDTFDKDLKLQVITAVLAVIGLVGAFWLGSSRDSQRKTEMLNGAKS